MQVYKRTAVRNRLPMSIISSTPEHKAYLNRSWKLIWQWHCTSRPWRTARRRRAVSPPVGTPPGHRLKTTSLPTSPPPAPSPSCPVSCTHQTQVRQHTPDAHLVPYTHLSWLFAGYSLFRLLYVNVICCCFSLFYLYIFSMKVDMLITYFIVFSLHLSTHCRSSLFPTNTYQILWRVRWIFCTYLHFIVYDLYSILKATRWLNMVSFQP